MGSETSRGASERQRQAPTTSCVIVAGINDAFSDAPFGYCIVMRLKIMRTPTYVHVDGIRLDGFHPGSAYQVGTTLAMLFLAEGWAVPAEPSESTLPLGLAELALETLGPPNLIRESYPPDYEGRFAVAADYSGRSRTLKQSGARTKVRRKPHRSSR